MKYLATTELLSAFSAHGGSGYLDFSVFLGPLVREAIQADHPVNNASDTQVNAYAFTYLKTCRRPRDSMKEAARKKEYRAGKKRPSSGPTGVCTAFDDEESFGDDSDDGL